MDDITYIAMIQFSGITVEEVDSKAVESAGFASKQDAIQWVSNKIQAVHACPVLFKNFELLDGTAALDLEIIHIACEDGPTHGYVIQVA